MTFHEAGGQEGIRHLWKTYKSRIVFRHHLTLEPDVQGLDFQAIIFVVDSSDRERFIVVQNELEWILHCNGPLLVFANKQDLPGCVNPEEILLMLNLLRVHEAKVHIEVSLSYS